MNTRTRFIGMGLMVAACAIAFAAQDAITLKYAPKQGDTTKYKMTADLQVGPGPATVTADVTNKITKADADTYTMEATQANLQITFNGNAMRGPDSTDTTTFKTNGEITDIQSDQMTADSWRVAELVNFIYPDKPVKIGDTWTYTVVADDKKGTVAATCDYKVDSAEKIGTHDCMKIKVTYKESAGTAAASSDGYTWIDTKDGSMVKSTSTWANVPIGGMDASGTVTLERAD